VCVLTVQSDASAGVKTGANAAVLNRRYHIPISNWVEHEISVEEGADLDAVARTLSVFSQIEGEIAAPRGSRRQHLRAG